jgi:hypothetical protein
MVSEIFAAGDFRDNNTLLLKTRSVATGRVWTVSALQEEAHYQRSVRVQLCIRPLNAAVWLLALMQLIGPNKKHALFFASAQNGFSDLL